MISSKQKKKWIRLYPYLLSGAKSEGVKVSALLMIAGFAIVCLLFVDYTLKVLQPSKTWAMMTLEAAASRVQETPLNQTQFIITPAVTLPQVQIMITTTLEPTIMLPTNTDLPAMVVPTNTPSPAVTATPTEVCNSECRQQIQQNVMLSLTPPATATWSN